MGTHCSTEVTSQTIMKFFALVAVFMCCLCATLAMPYPMAFPFAMPDEPGYGAAPAYGGAIGRVKIQAYRGPSKPGDGYDTFAPWGFYVTQPTPHPWFDLSTCMFHRKRVLEKS